MNSPPKKPQTYIKFLTLFSWNAPAFEQPENPTTSSSQQKMGRDVQMPQISAFYKYP